MGRKGSDEDGEIAGPAHGTPNDWPRELKLDAKPHEESSP